ncbi:MAG TPA: aminopeptidase P family protein [Acidimicrobiales bacterium]|nr:aminopeptidase P family protein [Acidimicrobiales bacterium]
MSDPSDKPHVPSPLPPERLLESMATGWAERPPTVTGAFPQAPFHAERRARVSERFPGEWIIVPTGGLKVRANDTDYRFRPGSDFAWLTGYHEPDAVLVMEPVDGGHRAGLFAFQLPSRETKEYFTDVRNSELWAGARLSLAEVTIALGIDTAPLDQLEETLKRIEGAPARVVRGYEPRVDALVAADDDADKELVRFLAECRLVKDAHEIACLEQAVAATVKGFEDVVRALPEAVAAATGERWVEGTFNRRARTEGNDVGYETIAACGHNACSLHWIKNDGPVRDGDLLLLDAGVEGPELYTADVTRTIPVSGRFTAEQREVYEVVLRAQRAGIAACRPGAMFLDPHVVAMRVIAEWLVEKGILACTVDDAMADDARLYQRYTLHGTSHMLGLDVHDCAASRDRHRGEALEAGMVLTVEPGCYLRPDDLTVPEQYRGIGVRIEDDVLITEDGRRVLSDALPTDPDEIERWMAALLD